MIYERSVEHCAAEMPTDDFEPHEHSANASECQGVHHECQERRAPDAKGILVSLKQCANSEEDDLSE